MNRIRWINLLALLILPFMHASGGPILAQSSGIPADVAALTDKGRAALKAGDLNVLRSLATSQEVLSWLGQRGRRTRSEWNLDVLPLSGGAVPASGQRYMAVFHSFHTTESSGDHVHHMVKTSSGWRFGPEILETDTLGYRVRDHRLSIHYDLPKATCQIVDDVTIERTGGDSKTCLLRLSDDMHLDGASLGRAPLPVRHIPGLILVDAPSARTFTIRLNYHGTVNHPGSDYILPSEAVLVSYWYPHVARLPAKLGVTATVPKGWTVIGQGELIRKVDGEKETTFTYRNEIPTCVFSLDAAPYALTSRTVDGRKLSACLIKPDEGLANRSLDLLAKALAFYEKSFGKYPYTHYEMVETRAPFGGALEAYSFSTYAQGAMPGAVPHEVSHTWWGGIVPNPYTKTLWNESFASYSDGLFRRQTSSTPQERALSGQHRSTSYGRDLVRAFAISIAEAYDTENGAHAGVGYGKGSIVLAMLEDLIGTEKMIRSMRRFREDHRMGEAGDWNEFAAAVKRTTGEDMSWFFDQWVNRTGVPVVKLENVTRTQQGDKWTVSAEIVQEGSPYRLQIPVVLDVAGGNSIRQRVEVTGARTSILYSSDSAPAALTLDPDGNVLMAGGKLADEKANPFQTRFE